MLWSVARKDSEECHDLRGQSSVLFSKEIFRLEILLTLAACATFALLSELLCTREV